MDFYYVVFRMPGGGSGSLVIQQVPGPDGFNLAGVHQYIIDQFKGAIPYVMVEAWHQITEKRYLDMKTFNAKMLGNFTAPGPRLGVVDGGGEKTGEKPAPSLMVVDAPETPPKA